MPERSGLFFGRVRNGKIELQNRNGFASLIARLNNCDIDLTLGKHRKKRSIPQNAYLHAVIIPLIGEAAGYDNDDMKSALKVKFLTVSDERGLPYVRGTSSLSTVEMSEFIDNCIRLGIEMFGIVFPAPEMQ